MTYKVDVMFDNRSAIQGMEVNNILEFKEWVLFETTEGTIRANREHIVYVRVKEVEEIEK